MLSPFLIMPLWPCRTFTVSLAQKVEVVQVLPLAARIIDQCLCAWGESSSSGCAFHPGEKPMRNRSPAERFTAIRLSGRSSDPPLRMTRLNEDRCRKSRCKDGSASIESIGMNGAGIMTRSIAPSPNTW
jgi:hypothetical protein